MEEQFNNFRKYLVEAQDKVFTFYPNALFYNGEYRPDIPNFHYEYNFANQSTGIKVVVNTFDEGHVNLLLMKTPMFTGLKPFDLPINFGLMDAYNTAIEKGLKPNLGGAIVFLQDDSSQPNGPQYWFLDGNSNKWITIDVNPALIITSPIFDHPSS